MAITIDTQSNPKVADAGKKEADATIISSGFGSGTVTYNIRRKDRQEDFTLSSNTNVSKYARVISISASQLKIILSNRTNYQVRVNRNNAGYSDWVNFKTRDKTYWTPDAITQLSDNRDDSATSKTSLTLTITNAAKATELRTSRGSTVTNTDKGYNGTTSVSYTSRGATVVTDTF